MGSRSPPHPQRAAGCRPAEDTIATPALQRWDTSVLPRQPWGLVPVGPIAAARLWATTLLESVAYKVQVLGAVEKTSASRGRG
jgi:hypothetical protein